MDGGLCRRLEEMLPQAGANSRRCWFGEAEDSAVYVFVAGVAGAAFYEGADRWYFSGIGHLPYEECPEEFNRALIEFLTRQG
jgi:pimeloyl-ACP methyl ester carboxylesterase